MEIPWRLFASYVGELTASYRRQLRATLHARDAAGLKVRIVERFAGELDRLFPLYEQVMERARYKLETLTPSFFQRLDDDLGNASRAIVLEHEGKPVAMAIMLYAGESATFLLAGIDYTAPSAWQVYPNLVTEVLADAIRSGASRLEMGQTSYPLKTRLGGVAVPRFLFLRYRHPFGAWLLQQCADRLFPEHTCPPRRVFHHADGSQASLPRGGYA
jgi:hypothetical protein